MTHYYQTEARETYCEICGELGMCGVFVAEYPEQETGYVDERAICAECRRGTLGVDESPTIKNRTGLPRTPALVRTERIRRSNF